MVSVGAGDFLCSFNRLCTRYCCDGEQCSIRLCNRGIQSRRGVKVKNIARFDGKRWEDLNTANIDTGEALFSIALLGDDVYVAGAVELPGSTELNGIAKY